jgi:tryptophan synthase beta chain
MTTSTAPGPRGQRSSVLTDIADRRAADIASELAGRDLRTVRRETPPGPAPRDVAGRFARPGLHLIAEIKRRSPSAGDLAAPRLDVAAQARAYHAGGASMISVLVEPHWFGGSLEDLRTVRTATSVPVLAKEFVVDARQLPLLRAAGADAVLLLAALHAPRELARLAALALELGLEPLVEAHDERELRAALGTPARLIGINNRDLRSLRVDPELAVRLRPSVPDDRLVVAESGLRDARTVRRWRALGFDGALVGEDLMRVGSDPAAVEARVAAYVSAGSIAAPGVDPAADGRAPFVKICGIRELAGLTAALTAGADAIGFNFVPGTPRALEEGEAAALVAAARSAEAPGNAPLLVGVFADRPPEEVAGIATRLGLDAVQLHGHEPPADLDAIPLPVHKVLHLPVEAVTRDLDGEEAAAAAGEGVRADQASEAPDPAAVEALVAEAARFQAKDNLQAILLDASVPGALGGTGRRAARDLARAVATRIPVILAGGLDAANVAEALIDIPAIGVDVSSGVEVRRAQEGAAVDPGPARTSTRPGLAADPAPAAADPAPAAAEPAPAAEPRPAKDPLAVALFVKRAAAARLDRPTVPFGPQPVDPGLLEADAHGRWGVDRAFGGRFVPETLMAALLDLEDAYGRIRQDPAFWAEFRDLLAHYVGRPTPLYRADRLAAELERRAGREPGGLRLYLKREDLAHTGAHKINNALGQALLTKRLGKPRVIAETGAGQHGVATATACALLELDCVVYMGAEDIRRQAPNVLRMRALGTEVREVTSGTATLKDAVNETMRDWVTNVETSHYVLGSVVGPHPFPTIVRDLQRVIGDEAAEQVRVAEGRLPDVAIACVGGGSNAMGLLTRFIGEPDTRLIGVEAAGEGLSGRHAAALAGGTPGVLHGSRSYLLQDEDGQVTEAHSISAGLDYPGIGPQLSALYAARRLEILSATDDEALEGVRLLTRTEGILPALEPAHAIHALVDLLTGRGVEAAGPADIVLLGLSGRGDKDIAAIEDRLMAGMPAKGAA